MTVKKVYHTNTEQTTGFFRLLDVVEVDESRVNLSVNLQVSACYGGNMAL
jgi:hypothetical protein